MRSKKIYITILIVLISLLYSCEDYLEPVTFDKISPSNFFETRNDVNAAVTGIYAEFANNYISRIYNGEYGTDEFRNNWGWGDAINNFLWSGDAIYSSLYHQSLPAVTRAGALIQVIEDIDFLNEQEKIRFIAEIKTARAIHMFDLLNSYGPCPVILDEEQLEFPDNSYKPVRPKLDSPESEAYRADYVDQIVNDLNDAINDLEADAIEFGRFNKGIALTILMKLYLHEKNWEGVVSTSEQIMGLGKYSLESDYASIWSIDNEQNDEIIWAIPRTSNLESFGQPFRARTLTSEYDLTEEEGWDGDKVRFEFYDTFNENDIRKEKIVVEFVDTDGDTIDMRAPGEDFFGGYNFKYDNDPDARTYSGVDIIYLRYADILLSRAEALNEINGPNQESINLINQVRERTGLSDVELAQFASKTELRDHILAERGWEFYMEGFRREDLIRNGKYISRAIARGAEAREYNVLYPIPQGAYRENSNIEQNPGYDL